MFFLELRKAGGVQRTCNCVDPGSGPEDPEPYLQSGLQGRGSQN